MKILLVGPCKTGFLPYSYLKAFNIANHEVFCFDSIRAYSDSIYYKKNRYLRRLLRTRLWNTLNSSLLEVIQCVRPQLALVFKGTFLHPSTVRRILTEVSIPIVNYYPDNPYCGVPINPYKTSAQRRNLIDCLREYNVVFNWSPHIVKRLREDGVNSAYLPFGVDEHTYNPSPNGADPMFHERRHVVFVGQRNKKRDKHIGAVRKHPVTVWGPLWEYASKKAKVRHEIHNERAFGGDCAAIYSNADISLNIVDDLNMPGHNMRTFEIPACRGLMLATYTDEQNEFFPEGEAAVYYRDPLELDDIVERLLKDKEGRERIKDNAYRIAKEHTYVKRAKKLLKYI